ncbi:MAG: YdbL family protein [Rhodospirillales bacterium]|nr:YdbL family protein [Rhodospirillales bacterium]
MRKFAWLCLALALLAPLPASAQPGLERAKAAGLVGERPDGLVGTVRPVPPDIAALVETINTHRIGEYRDIAQRNGTSVEAVQTIAGRRLAEQSAAGSYVMDAGGGWRRK